MTPRSAISRWTWARVMARHNFACALCGEPFADGSRVDLDHIHQRSRGGADDAANLRPLCIPCHKRKTARDARERAHEARLIRKAAGTWKRRGPKIQSRGFDKTMKRRIGGALVPRRAKEGR